MVAVARRTAPEVDVRHAVLPALRRGTRPGGRIALTVWPYPHPPRQQLWHDVIRTAGRLRLPTVALLAAGVR